MKVCSTLGRRESMKGRKLGLMQPIKAGQKQKFRNSNVSLQVPFFRNPGARLTMQHNLLQARGQDLQTRATTHMWRFLWIHEPTVVWFVPKPFTWIWSHTYSLQPIYPTHVFVTKLAILPWILPIQIVPSWIYACFNDYGGVILRRKLNDAHCESKYLGWLCKRASAGSSSRRQIHVHKIACNVETAGAWPLNY